MPAQYVEAYELSTLRIYVALFLALVMTGFLLLAWRVGTGRSLTWILARCGFATFALFATVQFLNVNGWVADYNVSQWQASPKKTLDLEYLRQLGPDAYSAQMRAVQEDRPERAELQAQLRRALGSVARHRLPDETEYETVLTEEPNWRSHQFRAERSQRLLVEFCAARQWKPLRNETAAPDAPDAQP